MSFEEHPPAVPAWERAMDCWFPRVLFALAIAMALLVAFGGVLA